MRLAAPYTPVNAVRCNVHLFALHSHWKPSHTQTCVTHTDVCLSFCLTRQLIIVTVKQGSLQKHWRTAGVGFFTCCTPLPDAQLIKTRLNTLLSEETMSVEHMICWLFTAIFFCYLTILKLFGPYRITKLCRQILHWAIWAAQFSCAWQ